MFFLSQCNKASFQVVPGNVSEHAIYQPREKGECSSSRMMNLSADTELKLLFENVSVIAHITVECTD